MLPGRSGGAGQQSGDGMTIDGSDGRSAGSRSSWRRARAAAALTTPGLGFWLPFFGPWLSIAAALIAVQSAGPAVWDSVRRPNRIAWLGVAALWLPAVLAFTGLFYLLFGAPESNRMGATAWLFLPLCGPENMVVPAAVALAVYVVGTAVSAATRRPWPWLVGGLAAAVAYDLTLHFRSIDLVC